MSAFARVVVLGSSGFVGSRLIAGLVARGVPTVAVSSATIDLCDATAVEALLDTVGKDDAVVFASCITRDKGEDDATLTRNILMAQHVGAFLQRAGCAQLVYLSSDAVYADTPDAIREDSECNAGGLYGLAHVAREGMLVSAALKAGVPLLILRLCAVYGADDTHHAYGPNRFMGTALRDGAIVLFGAGEETRDHVYVDDVCRLIERALVERTTGTFNVATGTAWSFGDVAEAVRRVVPMPVVIRSVPRRVAVTHRLFDVSALRRHFPGVAFASLREGLTKMLAEMTGDHAG